VIRSNDGRTPDHDDAPDPRPATTTTVTAPDPRQCSHCRTPAAAITSSTVRGSVGEGVGVELAAGADAGADDAEDAEGADADGVAGVGRSADVLTELDAGVAGVAVEQALRPSASAAATAAALAARRRAAVVTRSL